ncbi:hypothetical protein KUCAC02_037328, partial [Chaenocephalus aceratus]
LLSVSSEQPCRRQAQRPLRRRPKTTKPRSIMGNKVLMGSSLPRSIMGNEVLMGSSFTNN